MACQAHDSADMMLKAAHVGMVVHLVVRRICLTELLHKNMQRKEAEHCQEVDQVITGQERQGRNCKGKTRQLMCIACLDVKALKHMELQLTKLQVQVQKVKQCEGKRRYIGEDGGQQPRNMNELKHAILRGAHVVLSTINSCWNTLPEEVFGRTNPCTFFCVLISEATQCTEVEALLCL